MLRVCISRPAFFRLGSVALNLNLLKPRQVLFSASADAHYDTKHPSLHHAMPLQAQKVWLEYVYRKHHPVLQWLPTKLAEARICKMTLDSLTRQIPEGAGRQWN